MPDLTTLPHDLDEARRTCRAIVETPRGSRNKATYDPESGLFQLTSLLPEGMQFPFDFGFVPSTLGEDGDPVDILVFMDAPAHVGCLLDVRVVGVFLAEQTERGRKITNDRVVGVSVESSRYEHVDSIRDMGKRVRDQVKEFFLTYARQRGKSLRIVGTGGPRRGISALKAGIKAFESREHT